MDVILVIIYLALCLFIGRWLYRRTEPDWDSLQFVAATIFISPLLLLGWLQEKAKIRLNKWYNEAKK